MYTEMPAATPMDLTDPAIAEPQNEVPAPLAFKEGDAATGKPKIIDDVVIEEVSIDGMCGVY